ncbi:HIT family protein [Candidatus Bipolaricaulota bacterium]|nr:HIT family protein [Candidatus Bipolaricaulota bacterium]
MNCPFCRIAQGQLFAHLLYEDDRVLAFLDAEPMVPGHTLVVPKAHVERFTELPEEEASRIFAVAVRVGRALQEALGAPGFTVGLNDGRVAGQGVPHVHLHLIPRFPGDGGKSLHSILPYRPLRTDPEIASRVRAILSAQGK